MNKRDWIVLSVLVNHGYSGQRDLSRRAGYSIGLVSSELKKMMEEGYINEYFHITDKTREYMESSRPRRAVILAAGMGLRMMPISKVPKGLLKVNDEPLIERIITQLDEVGVSDITVVTGFMTEKLDYLIDKFGVSLVYDPEYTRRDSLQSLSLAADNLANCYIVPSNVWFSRNPFNKNEFFSWYAVSDYIDDDSHLRLNRKLELVYTEDEHGGNSMIGLGYLLKPEASKLRAQIKQLIRRRKYHNARWERALWAGNKMITYARVMQGQSTYEINTYEQLRELDSESKDLQSKRIDLICKVFDVSPDRITDISRLFKGLTNRLMRFSVDGAPYLLRVPGEGSNELTNRTQEAEVYKVLEGTGMTERIVYISPPPHDGHKISEYLENSRVCNPFSKDDVSACMTHMRKLHEMKLEVAHTFDIMEKIELYEKLQGERSSFEDYDKVRAGTLELLDMLAALPREITLCHADPVPDNFLLVDKRVYLIDWEYAGMCEPQADIAMFGLYADYDKEWMDWAIDAYYEGQATPIDRFKVYAYASAGGFLWTIWCEYKGKMGVNYSEYAMRQYRYAKRFYRYAMRLAEHILPEIRR